METFPYCNGLDAEQGGYLSVALPEPEIARWFHDRFSGEIGHQELDRLDRLGTQSKGAFPVVFGIDEGDLSQTGWAAIFPEGVDPAVREALGPLLDHRREQASSRWEQGYRELTGATSYRPGESAEHFLRQFGVGIGDRVNPRMLPYHLLLVGGPEHIPYEVQHELGISHAVGRLDLPSPEAYARYAETVLAVEKGTTRRSRQAVFFGPANPNDQATELSSRNLLKLADELATKPGLREWELTTVLGPDATRARLIGELSASSRPALLMAAGHGVSFAKDLVSQRELQGALVCQDWPGPLAAPLIHREQYFAAEDLAREIDLQGLVVFLFNCFGLGTPDRDDFYSLTPSAWRAAEMPFTARLPQRLLQQGALAVLGHVDRAWRTSFLTSGSGRAEDPSLFTECLHPLMAGKPAGFSRESFAARWTGLSALITGRLQAERRGEPVDLRDYSRLGLPAIDARNYVLLGDPATRLVVS
ncbi:MAG TPA: hypothetical protein VF017_18465 [Thermoanaerobaculia bacterium]|nr:hypothetical protein [Thermoanaerobaculia bacterium]